MKRIMLLFSILLSLTSNAQWENLGTIDNGDISGQYNCDKFIIEPNLGKSVHFYEDKIYIPYMDSSDCKRVSIKSLQNNKWTDTHTQNTPQSYNKIITAFKLDTLFLIGEINDSIYLHKLFNNRWTFLNKTKGSLLEFKSTNNYLYVLQNDCSVLKYDNTKWDLIVDPVSRKITDNVNFTIDNDTLYVGGITDYSSGNPNTKDVMIWKSINGVWVSILQKTLLNPTKSYFLKIDRSLYLFTNYQEKISVTKTIKRNTIDFYKDGSWKSRDLPDTNLFTINFSNLFNYKNKLGISYFAPIDSTTATRCYSFDGNQFETIEETSYNDSGDWISYIRAFSNNEYLYMFYTNQTSIQADPIQYTVKRLPFNILDVSDSKIESNIKIYPNPTTDILNISFDNPSNYSIKIIDNLGFVIDSKTLNGSNYQLSLNNLSKGLYFIQILDNSNNILETQKLILE